MSFSEYYQAGLGLGSAYGEGQMDAAKLKGMAGLEAERQSMAKYRGAQVQELMRKNASGARAKTILAKEFGNDIPPAAALPQTEQPAPKAGLSPVGPYAGNTYAAPGLAQGQPQHQPDLSPGHLMKPEIAAKNPGEAMVRAGQAMMSDPLVDNETALEYITKGQEMSNKVADFKAKHYWPLLTEMYKNNDQQGIDNLIDGLKKDPATWKAMGEPNIKSGAVGSKGTIERDMTDKEAYATAKKILPPDLVGGPENWPAGRYHVSSDGKKPEMKRIEDKNQTEEQLTAKALKGDKEAQAVLDAMQKRKLGIAAAGRASIEAGRSKEIDIPSISQGVWEGTDAPMAIRGSMGNPVSSKVRSEVLKMSKDKGLPPFNFMMADANYKWKQSSINQRTINFAGGALPRVQALDEQLSKLPNVDLNTINRVMRAVSVETGKPEYTNFESNRNAIVQEINTALSGSATGSDMRVKIELENLTAARSPAQIKGAVSNLREALIARLDVDLSPIYPIEVVRGEKTMEQYKNEMFKKYRGKYTKIGEPAAEGTGKKSLSEFWGK
jgi:hypothetical protein